MGAMSVTPKQVKDVANKWFANKRPTLAGRGESVDDYPDEHWVNDARAVLNAAAAIGWTPPPEPEPVYPIRLTLEQKHILAQTVSQRMAVDEFESRVLDELSDLIANATPEEL